MQIPVLVITPRLMAVGASFFIDAVRASNATAPDGGVDRRRSMLVIGFWSPALLLPPCH